MPRPHHLPLGVALTRTSKAVSRAFDAALVEAGGSLPVWLILLGLKSGHTGSQRALAAAVDVKGPTLTHHLDGMQARGLVRRQRDPANRRLHLVELTDAGDALFHRLRRAAVAHDARLQRDMDEGDAERLRALLDTLRRNVADRPEPVT